MASRRMAYYNAAYRQEFSVLDRRELRPPPARLSAGGRAICDPEIVAWLRETVSPKAAAKKPQDQKPDLQVARLGFADTLAWGVRTLGMRSSSPSVVAPALTRRKTGQKHSAPTYAQRLTGNPNTRKPKYPVAQMRKKMTCPRPPVTYFPQANFGNVRPRWPPQYASAQHSKLN